MSASLEERIYQTGRWLYELIEGETPSVFKKEYWTGKVMEWCMKDENFKVQMFRFIDVLPYLTTPQSVTQHLNEYFCKPGMEIPPVLQWGIKGMGLTSFTSKIMAQSITDNIKSMGKSFIAAESPEEALPVLEKLRKDGLAFSVDLLGEAVVSEEEAEEYQRRYLELLDVLNNAQKNWSPINSKNSHLDWGHAPMINLSIKPSAMYSQMKPQAFEYSVDQAKERLRPIFQKAMEIGAHITLDMEHYELKDLTIALFKSIKEEAPFRDYPEFGIVIQSYLKSSWSDCEELIEWARKNNFRFAIRLVKGAYWDAEVIWARQKNWPVPVFTQKPQTDFQFERLANYILTNHEHVYFACASHNIRSISYVMETAKDLNVPRSSYEFQILYGMAEPVRKALLKAGLPLRLYTPIGEMIPGMAYLIRRLLENTANESFLRQSFSEGKNIDELLRNPEELIREDEEEPVKTTAHETTIGSFQNEPPIDWTIEENRMRFQKAIKEVRRQIPFKAMPVVKGKQIKTKKKIESVNPNKFNEVVGYVSVADRELILEAVKAAKEAFPAWRDTPPEKRAEMLIKAASIAREKRYFLAALQVLEVGKSWSEADADVCEAIDFLEYYAREMLRLSKPRKMGNVPGEISELFYEPKGTALVIAPWNFPLAISTGMTSAALVTGNTVIYKPSSQSAITGSMMVKFLMEAGIPKGVINYLPCSGSLLGETLLNHPDIQLIAFTGSKEVGLHIIAEAAKPHPKAQDVKTVIAEMGGKNAIIVDSDADLDEAVVHVLQSAFGYQGQKCSACSRVIVLEENYDRFLKRLKAAAESLLLGPVEDPKHFMGAVIDASARKKILDYIEQGKKDGNVLVCRSFGDENQGFFVPLTIISDLAPDHTLCQEEIFGPVLVILKAKNFDEALEIALSTPFALTGGVFSRSPANIAKAREKFRVGNLYINRGITGAIVGRHPFGGFKLSGVGSKAGGPDYLLQFMIPRNVVENTLRRGFAPSEEE